MSASFLNRHRSGLGIVVLATSWLPIVSVEGVEPFPSSKQPSFTWAKEQPPPRVRNWTRFGT